MTACVICARDAEHGYLCAGCFTRLSSMLRDIEDEAAVLDAVPSMQQRTGSGGGSLASHRAPVVLDAIVARDPRRGTGRIGYDDSDPWGIDDTASVLETLHSRARIVREECPTLRLPARGLDPGPERVTVSGERDLLTRNLEWIARQPWVDEMFTEMRELLGQLQRTNKTQPERPVGVCQLPRFDSICGGRIWQREEERSIWRQAEPGGDRCRRVRIKVSDGPAYCERCRNTWDDPVELNRLHLIEEMRVAEAARPKTDDGRRMLTVKELAARLRTSENNVRVKAHRLGAAPISGHYDPEPFERQDKATA